MKKTLSVFSAELSVFSYSTEDEKKVQRAVLNAFPRELWGMVKFSPQIVKGHYNDSIMVLSAKMKKEAESFALYLLSQFSPTDRRRLLDDLDSRMDSSGNLYIRLNKQEAFLGEIELGESDPIWIKLKFKSSGRSVSIFSVRETLSTIFGGAEESQETLKERGPEK
jgi:RNA binding exosome subunit